MTRSVERHMLSFPFLCSSLCLKFIFISRYKYIFSIQTHSSHFIYPFFYILAIYYIFLSYPLHAFYFAYCVCHWHTCWCVLLYIYIYTQVHKSAPGTWIWNVFGFYFFSMFTPTVAATEETRGKITRTLYLSFSLMYINNSLSCKCLWMI